MPGRGAVLGLSWPLLGRVGPPWGGLGPQEVPKMSLLDPSSGPSWHPLGALVGRFWAIWSLPEALLGPFRGRLGPSWGRLEAILGRPGAILSLLGTSVALKREIVKIIEPI